MRDTQKKFYKKLLGRRGERRAEKYLKKQGYTLLERNYIATVGEADLIMSDGETIVFIEVKTRSSEFVDPLGAIDRRRVSRIVRAANSYVKAYNIPHEVQFDVIIIIGTPESGNMPQVEHIPDAFLPPLRTIR